MKKLFYLRHGLSELNLLYIFCGSTDSPLADIGREEALLAGKRFNTDKLTKGTVFEAIFSSPLSRAFETAKLYTEGAKITKPGISIEPLLTERDFGSLEKTRYSKQVSSKLLNDNLPEGVEKWDDVVDRAKKLLRKVESYEGNILLVGHGSIGRALKKVINDEYQTTLDWKQHIPNSEITRLI